MVYKTVEAYRDGYHQIFNQSASEHEIDDTEQGVALSTSAEHPTQIWYLFLAFALHITGNVITVCDFLNPTPFVSLYFFYVCDLDYTGK